MSCSGVLVKLAGEIGVDWKETYGNFWNDGMFYIFPGMVVIWVYHLSRLVEMHLKIYAFYVSIISQLNSDTHLCKSGLTNWQGSDFEWLNTCISKSGCSDFILVIETLWSI